MVSGTLRFYCWVVFYTSWLWYPMGSRSILIMILWASLCPIFPYSCWGTALSAKLHAWFLVGYFSSSLSVDFSVCNSPSIPHMNILKLVKWYFLYELSERNREQVLCGQIIFVSACSLWVCGGCYLSAIWLYVICNRAVVVLDAITSPQ